MSIKSFLLVAAGAVAATVASFAVVGVATAADGSSAPKMHLHFKPEDLNSEEGVHKVYLQIKSAAESVCPGVATGTYLASESTLKCRQQAITSAVEAIHSKRLAEVASASKSG